MKKNDLVVVLDRHNNVIKYTKIERVNQKTYTVEYSKYDKESLKITSDRYGRGNGHHIELFDKEKYGDGYKFDILLTYKEEVKELLENLQSIIDISKKENNYVGISWEDYEDDLENLIENLKEEFLGDEIDEQI